MANYQTLDLNLLRVFDALFSTRNVTRASEILNVTQPAVSAALSRMRGHFNDPLFVREGNGMAPTERAERLHVALQMPMQAIRSAVAEDDGFDPATATTTFTVRGADFFSMRLMPQLARRLSVEAPGVQLRFLDSGRGELVEILQAGEVDVALEQPAEVPSWVASTLLFPSPFRVVATAGHPATTGLSAGDVMPLDSYCQTPHVLRSIDGSDSGMVDAALASVGRSRRVAVVLPHFEAVLRTVAGSDLISTIPAQLSEAATAMGLEVFMAPVDVPAPDIRMYWHSRLNDAMGQRWFRTIIQEEIGRLWGHDDSFD